MTAELVHSSNLLQPLAPPPSPPQTTGSIAAGASPLLPLPNHCREPPSPPRLPLSSLLRLPHGTPIPTLLPSLNLTLISNLSVNGVPITHTNLFTSGPHIVHGVATSFLVIAAVNPISPMKSNWARAVKTLRSKGYVSFALGLNAILDSLKESLPKQVTVFAPRGSGMAHEAYVLKRVVKRHAAVGEVSVRGADGDGDWTLISLTTIS